MKCGLKVIGGRSHNGIGAATKAAAPFAGVIQRIEAQAEPLSDRVISSEAPVTAVLELAGGAAGRLGIKPGDLVRHAAFDAAKKP